MVGWFWIPISFMIGGVFGVLFAALVSAGNRQDDGG